MDMQAVNKIQRDLANKMRELDNIIDIYAKLVVELELLEIESKNLSE